MKNDPDELLPTRWTLIERLKNWDDQESWRQFFDTYWKLIYGVAIKSGLTHPEAQDVVQETVMSVCKSMQNFKADPKHGSFKSLASKLDPLAHHRPVQEAPPNRKHEGGPAEFWFREFRERHDSDGGRRTGA